MITIISNTLSAPCFVSPTFFTIHLAFRFVFTVYLRNRTTLSLSRSRSTFHQDQSSYFCARLFINALPPALRLEHSLKDFDKVSRANSIVSIVFIPIFSIVLWYYNPEWFLVYLLKLYCNNNLCHILFLSNKAMNIQTLISPFGLLTVRISQN